MSWIFLNLDSCCIRNPIAHRSSTDFFPPLPANQRSKIAYASSIPMATSAVIRWCKPVVITPSATRIAGLLQAKLFKKLVFSCVKLLSVSCASSSAARLLTNSSAAAPWYFSQFSFSKFDKSAPFLVLWRSSWIPFESEIWASISTICEVYTQKNKSRSFFDNW
jgi:hypothetical protein